MDIDYPVLVRVRLTDIDRVKFAQEANAMATISPSAIENARTDAANITLNMINKLDIGESEGIEDALRAPKNQPFAKQFLSTLPGNVQAALVDAKGYLNRDGVHRMAMAIFVSAFQGDVGLRLAEKAFETVDMDVKSIVNAIGRSLGKLAEAESLIHAGQRDKSLSIADDLAQTIVVYSAIKSNPALTVEKYLKQSQLFTRELSTFQEGMLSVIENNRRSAKRLGNILSAYADNVIRLLPPEQTSMLPMPSPTKEELWEKSVNSAGVEQQPEMIMHKNAAGGDSLTNEVAFTICKCGGHLVKGSEIVGQPDKVKLNVHCPCGDIVGVHHTHPGGTCELSNKDISEAKRLDLGLMCVTVPETKETCCWRVN